MSKLTVGQDVVVNFPNPESTGAVHLLDEKQPVHGKVVYVHENGNVNVSVIDHVGTQSSLSNVSTKKDDEAIYVTAVK